MAKTRSDSTISQLTEDQRDQLFDWLGRHSYSDVHDLAAKPLADGGLGIRFHRNTLIRFHESETAERRHRHFAEVAASSAPGNLPPEFTQNMIAAKARYAEATYNLSKAADEPENYDRFQRAIHHFDLCAFKCRQLDLEQERIQISRERVAEMIRQFEFNGAREVMKAYLAYQEIDQRTDIDEIDKIWEARKVAYGPRADETPKPPRPNKSTQIHAVPKTPLSPQSTVLSPKENTQIHARAETPLGPPGSRPAPASSLSSQDGAPRTQIHAAPKNPLRTQASELRTEAQRDTQIHAVPETPLRTQDSGPSTEPPTARRNRDTIVHTSSHSAANDTPLGPPGSRPAPAPSLSPDKSTQIHAVPESPEPRTQNSGSKTASSKAIHNGDTIVNTGSHYPADAKRQLRTQDSELGTYPQAQSLSAEGSRPARTADPKPPAAWLAAARHPADLRRHFAAQYCGHSPVRLMEFLASTEPLAIPLKVLQSFDELP